MPDWPSAVREIRKLPLTEPDGWTLKNVGGIETHPNKEHAR